LRDGVFPLYIVKRWIKDPFAIPQKRKVGERCIVFMKDQDRSIRWTL